MVARFALLAACLLAAADALVVGGRGLSSVRQAATPLAPFTIMKSQEDKEFEEWARKKKIAAGVDPDEDFAAGREAESKIYVVGGAPAPPRHPPAHPPPGATHSQPPRARFAALCAECGVRCSLRCSELCVPLFVWQGSSRCSFPRSPASGPTTRATSRPSESLAAQVVAVVAVVAVSWAGRACVARAGVWRGTDDNVALLRHLQLCSLGSRLRR